MILAAAAAIMGAAVGAAITWRLGRPSRELAAQVSHTQQHLAKLEDEYSRWEMVRHLAPRTFLQGEPPETQEVVLESEDEFRITSVAYLTGSGRPVVTQPIDLRGRRVAHAVDDQYVRAVLRMESNPWDGSGTVQLRFRAILGDLEKDIVFVASVLPEFRLGPAGRMMEYRRVVDPRAVPSASAMVN
ncbi:hypothetical protein Acid345_0288 [Candidatus Koribacter versatilis Ellin345]|uniref:Uncharacterized protein n=1 Tax=Koribacter versatilis (strain Ellin345) TaxID=204669 RepID=Q1IV07_KORVE|nr:hypothetical protein [Candidatus Koribacter versatilis]ABF39293.1 hypothetical protein Acid345_0288 [Candidatus Koribacter versatilis Ellin345]